MCILSYIWNNFWSIIQTILSWIAIYYALDIANKQIRLSNEQGKVIDRQIDLLKQQNSMILYSENLSKDRYTVQVLINNIQEVINKINSVDVLLQDDINTPKYDYDLLRKHKKELDDWLWELYDTLDKAMDRYNKTMNNTPIWIELRDLSLNNSKEDF